MPTVRLTTEIHATVERVFDLGRDVDIHAESMAPSDERAVAGVTAGELDEGDRVTWRARHFGLPLELTVEVTAGPGRPTSSASPRRSGRSGGSSTRSTSGGTSVACWRSATGT